jgi:hypothetical protein
MSITKQDIDYVMSPLEKNRKQGRSQYKRYLYYLVSAYVLVAIDLLFTKLKKEPILGTNFEIFIRYLVAGVFIFAVFIVMEIMVVLMKKLFRWLSQLETRNWNQYTNEKYQFFIKYPKKWIIVEQSPELLRVRWEKKGMDVVVQKSDVDKIWLEEKCKEGVLSVSTLNKFDIYSDELNEHIYVPINENIIEILDQTNIHRQTAGTDWFLEILGTFKKIGS